MTMEALLESDDFTYAKSEAVAQGSGQIDPTYAEFTL